MEVDVNKPLENPILSSMLVKLGEVKAQGNGARYNDCMNDIAREVALNARFLTVIGIDDSAVQDNGDGSAVFKKDSSIILESLTAADGKHFFPAFTDWNELRKSERYRNNNIKTLILSFDDYVALTQNNDYGLVINPFSDNVVFSKENIVHMKEVKDNSQKGVHKQVIEKDTTVKIGIPENYPHIMVDAIARRANYMPEVKAIWLKLMIKEGEKSYLLIVDFVGDRQNIFGQLAEAGTPYLEPGMYIDMVPYNDEFGQSAASGEPFYKKAVF